MSPLLYALPDNEAFTLGLCASWPAERGLLELHRFPDGESLVRLASDPRGRDVAMVCTLREPDSKILPLLLAVETARDLGARSVGLIAPYLAYMRQDRRFHAGESRSAAHFARLLSAHFDWIVTVDPHLHRYHALEEIYAVPAAAVPAAPLMARWIATGVEQPLLIGPDEESRQWVERIAREAGAPFVILEKTRLGDRRVELRVPDVARWKDHTPVLVDDIISSGGTMIETIGALRAQGLRAPVCVAVHAVFADWAYWGLLEAGAQRIVTTNTVTHVSNAIDVCAAVATGGRALTADRSASGAIRDRGRAIAR